MDYNAFIDAKRHTPSNHGIEPLWMPDGLFDFQRYVAEYGIRKGRCAEFLDTGLGKTIIELTTAVNYHKHTGKPVLILTPLAVAFQFQLLTGGRTLLCHRHHSPRIEVVIL